MRTLNQPMPVISVTSLQIIAPRVRAFSLATAAIDRQRSEPVSVTFLVNPNQLAALVVLANYDRPGVENVAIPFMAGCQAIGVMGYQEARSPLPRGVVGMMDLSARQYMRAQVGEEQVTFTVSFGRFLELEGNVPGSFLEEEVWGALRGTPA